MGNNSLNVDLTNQDEKNPGIVEKIKNNPVARKVLLTLGALGVMATTDTSAQNIVGNSLPTTPSLKSIEATGALLTNNEVIALLQSNKDKLTQKYPSLKDETIWLKVIGALAAGVAKKETIDYLANAFDKDTDENKKLIAFGISLAGSKPGNGSNLHVATPAPGEIKKPALGAKEAEDAKKLKDKNDKIYAKAIKSINDAFLNTNSWSSLKDKPGISSVSIKGKIITVKYKKSDSKLPNPSASVQIDLPPLEGTFQLTVNSDDPDLNAVVWILDVSGKTLNQDGTTPDGGFVSFPIKNGINEIICPKNCARLPLAITVSKLKPEVNIKELKLEKIETENKLTAK